MKCTGRHPEMNNGISTDMYSMSCRWHSPLLTTFMTLFGNIVKISPNYFIFTIFRSRYSQTSERVWQTMMERLEERENEIMKEKDNVLENLKEYVSRLRVLMKWHNPLNTNTRTFMNTNSLEFIKKVAEDTKLIKQDINRFGKSPLKYLICMYIHIFNAYYLLCLFVLMLN